MAEPMSPELQLADPQLAEQGSFRGVVSVIPDPLRDEVPPVDVVQRDPKSPVSDLAIEFGPERLRCRRIGLLESLCSADASIERSVAKVRQVVLLAQFNRTLRDLVDARGLDLRESARLLAYVNVATADTMIACWEAKYHYYRWRLRPNHAIQRADTDGNPKTSPDPTWLPLIVGNHPEYPSGHACITAALTESLHNYFGTKKVRLVISSTAPGAGPPRTYENLDELVKDVENARVWGGLHFRSTMTRTANYFPRIADAVGERYFLANAG
jgi:hypothetical protein